MASFFGDGTCNMGQFYECMNMAALYKLPILFVVENNKWAIGMNHPRATAPSLGDSEPWIYKKASPACTHWPPCSATLTHISHLLNESIA